jgi:hypothetical protein
MASGRFFLFELEVSSFFLIFPELWSTSVSVASLHDGFISEILVPYLEI